MSIIKNIQEPLLELNEVAIIPSKTTKIESRTRECNARMSNGKLPIFVSPMDSILNEDNFTTFNKDVIAILPRTVEFHKRIDWLRTGCWVAFGLNETQILCDWIETNNLDPNTPNLPSYVRICIDQANGHMEKLIKVGERLRSLIGDEAEIMIGNIANPRTFVKLAYSDFADWVRIGIGGGSVCTTSVQTGVHYPMASLVSECHYYKSTFEFGEKRVLKIVADGGINDSGDICKCLALGADAVMCGRLFCSVEESASPFLCDGTQVGTNSTIKFKEYWGMSTKRAQRNMGYLGDKNSEGILDVVPVECTLAERIEQFESSIKSSMSYCNAYNLDEFRINSILTRITPAAFAAYHKNIQNV